MTDQNCASCVSEIIPHVSPVSKTGSFGLLACSSVIISLAGCFYM